MGAGAAVHISAIFIVQPPTERTSSAPSLSPTDVFIFPENIGLINPQEVRECVFCNVYFPGVVMATFVDAILKSSLASKLAERQEATFHILLSSSKS